MTVFDVYNGTGPAGLVDLLPLLVVVGLVVFAAWQQRRKE